MKPKTSCIWYYFSTVDDNFAKCNICEKNYSRKGRTTTSLKGHLRSMHKDEYEELIKIEEQRDEGILDQSTSAMPIEQVNITQHFLEESSSLLWDISHPKAKKMDDIIGEMIALQNLPFDFVEGIGFRRVMQTALPNYQLRGRQFFIDHICNEIYTKMATKIRRMLENLVKLSFTAYIWSEPTANVSLLSLTAHGINEDFTRVQIVLKCCSLHGRHSGDIICDNFKIMLRDWNIQDKQLHCLIKDGGSNIFREIPSGNVPYISSTVHQLHLCVRSSLESLEVKDLIVKCRKISEYFNQSQTAQDELTKIQTEELDQPALRVIQDCINRWNSTLYMIERLLKVKNSICLYASKHNIPYHISEEEWLYLSKIVAILTPFEEVTNNLSDTNTCISSVIPLIHELKDTLKAEKDKSDTSDGFKNIIQKLIQEIHNRFCDLPSNKLYALATYLDPRYKLKFFNEIIKEQVQSTLLLLLSLHYLNVLEVGIVDKPSAAKKARVESNPLNDNSSTNFPISPITQSVYSNLAEMLNNSNNDEDGNDFTDNNDVKTWKSLINDYNNEARLQLNENPLMWWRYNIKYNVFVPIVRTYLSAPSSSVPNEKLFSGAGSVYEPLKNRFGNDKAEKLLFVKYNLPLLNFDY